MLSPLRGLRRAGCGEDFIFFADEPGSFQVGVPWSRVIPAWLSCLAQTCEPDAFAQGALRVIDGFVGYERDKHLRVARGLASQYQKRALRERIGAPSLGV